MEVNSLYFFAVESSADEVMSAISDLVPVAFESIEKLLAEGHASPKELLSEILYGMPHTEVGRSPVFFGCNCSNERILASLATLPRHEVEDLYGRGEVLEIACDYCRKEYRITPELLKGLVGEMN